MNEYTDEKKHLPMNETPIVFRQSVAPENTPAAGAGTDPMGGCIHREINYNPDRTCLPPRPNASL